MTSARRSFVGRAELLMAQVAYARRGERDAGLAAAAELLGYERKASPLVEPRSAGADGEVPTHETPARKPSAPLRPVPLWQPRTLVWHEDRSHAAPKAATEAQAAAAEADERADLARTAPPSVPLLSSRRRVMPMLERAFVRELAGDEVDVEALVRRIARGQWVVGVPRLPRRGWPALVVLVDRDHALVPFWADQRVVLGWLRLILGPSRIVIRIIDDRGPEGRMFDRHGRPVPPLDGSLAGVPVLALTDLGWYRGAGHQRAWLRLGRRLRRAGEQIHALVPVPAARWTPAISSVWRPLAWERPAPEDAAASEPDVRRERVERLLTMAAYAHRLEPGLLRALRGSLSRQAADAGTEADAWLHETMGGSFAPATVVRAEHAQALREKITAQDAERARDALRRWHWHRERQPELWHSEVLALAREVPQVVDPAHRERATAFAERLGERAKRALQAGHEGTLEELRRWLDYVEEHAPKQLWETTSAAGLGLQRAWWATHDDDEPPPFADAGLQAELHEGVDRMPRPIELDQRGRWLGPALRVEDAGSPVARVSASGRRGYLMDEAGRSRPLDLLGERWIGGRPGQLVELRMGASTLRLAALEKPAWASAIGRDRFGLWAETRVGEVRFRMRWIAPGRFVMGSPEDEPGRQSWEGPQHEVTITRGFWLGETPVTQALWKAVTSESPSHFKGADRPVENVSWEDCRERLIAGLNEAIGEDEGRFRLPTEAEWEHACRAGTSTATYAGPIEIRGENDAPVLDEIAWYGGNSGVDFEFEDGADSSGWPNKQYPHTRAGTRRVGQKQPNAWGLFDMLGNVWEWCEDSWGGEPYSSSEPQQDPTGAATGGSRVIRGGSWDALARLVRAAFRLGSLPGLRLQVLGLRLARDQQPALQTGGLESVGPEDPKGPEGPGRGRGGIGADERGAPGPDVARPRRPSVR